MKRPRLLLADYHWLLIDALKKLLEPDHDVVGLVGDGPALLIAARKLAPEVIVLNIDLPQLNGLDACRQLKPTMPYVKFIFMTMNEDPYLVGEAFRAGASAFLLKQAAALEVTEAIRVALKGGSYVTASARKGLDEIALLDPKYREHAPQPTARQREVIQLLAEGHTLKGAAKEMQITPRTVAAHKYTIMDALHLKTTAELVQYAIKQRIISV